MRKILTAAFVETAQASSSGQIEYWDTKVPGFGLRVSFRGRKAWTLVYRYQGRPRRFTIGTYPPLGLAEARDLARFALAEVQRGNDPATEKKEMRAADSFADLAERYMRDYAAPKKRASSVKEDRKLLRRELLPAWGARKAADITRRDVIALVDRIAAKPAPIGANRTLALASKIFNFGVSKELVSVNPAWHVPKPGKERAETRTLTDGEIRVVWRALSDERYGDLFRLLLLLGQRRTETAEMRWTELDLAAGWWTIPGTRTKNGLQHRVPLTETALSILQCIRRLNSDFVFPGLRESRPVVNLAKPLERIIKRAAVANFTMHDLRRTAATGMAQAGVQVSNIARVLNHSSAITTNRITLIYDRHTYDREKRDALCRWEARLMSIIAEDSEITAFSSTVG
jgi:integrase